MDKEQLKRLMPLHQEVKKGESYAWCRCESNGDNLACVIESDCNSRINFTASNNEWVSFCRCKQTKHPPFCDGSHGNVLIKALNKKQ